MSLDRINKLNALGFIWDPLEAQWLEMYEELVKFKREAGHCNVSEDDKDDELAKLGRWVGRQRRKLCNGTMRKDRQIRLEELGFQW